MTAAAAMPSNEIDKGAIVGAQSAATAPEHEFDEVDRGPLIAVDESVVGGDRLGERARPTESGSDVRTGTAGA